MNRGREIDYNITTRCDYVCVCVVLKARRACGQTPPMEVDLSPVCTNSTGQVFLVPHRSLTVIRFRVHV
ncbi:predicted protein [Chaetoceros tenuissimus]|uniref:Uncharacterized protein n=1 Tax=Chaetoceros tenuissimus TaxID=426638 RepID=A0AAD3CQZ9_9STRA|nr:predicted protein [Chaetoceros tenuissimus]